MNRMAWLLLTLLALLTRQSGLLWSDEYRVEAIREAAPADGLSPDVAARLSNTGVRVVGDGDRAVIEFWPCKQWNIQADFQPTAERLYPFVPGELIGVARLTRRGNDFRSQDIARGVYTLRYGLQPVDGNHVGTSPTRDFLLLVKAAEDTSPDTQSLESLIKVSAAAAGASHPAILGLQKPDSDAAGPGLRQVESNEWWVLRFSSSAGPSKPNLPVDLIVVGHAAE